MVWLGSVSMFSKFRLIFFVVVLIGGCSAERDSDSLAESSETHIPGVYSGVFPCESCPGIPTTLWLRSDGRFFMEQSYPETDERGALMAHGLGRWRWIADDNLMVLKGAGPGRTFTRVNQDTLAMQTESDLEHRLNRDPTSPEFSAIVRMAGLMRMRDGSASFTECLTGFVAPVERGKEFGRFLHQYRSVGVRGKPTYVELEGRFTWSRDGTLRALTIERFVTVRADGAC